jgi:hypothetical protein
MTDPERDPEFEAYLRRRSMLPNRQRATENLEPPHDLDDIVLRKARQAIQSPQQLPVYRAPRWALPVALAATILVCLSIVLNVSLNGNKAGEKLLPFAPGATGEQQLREVPKDAASPAPAVPSPAPPAAAAAAPSFSRSSKAAPSAVGPPASGRGEEDQKAAAPQPSMPTYASAITGRITDAAPAPRPAPGAPLEQAARDATQDPESWLKHIEALRAAGKNAAADAELARFKAAFPAYPVTPARPLSSEPPK